MHYNLCTPQKVWQKWKLQACNTTLWTAVLQKVELHEFSPFTAQVVMQLNNDSCLYVRSLNLLLTTEQTTDCIRSSEWVSKGGISDAWLMTTSLPAPFESSLVEMVLYQCTFYRTWTVIHCEQSKMDGTLIIWQKGSSSPSSLLYVPLLQAVSFNPSVLQNLTSMLHC